MPFRTSKKNSDNIKKNYHRKIIIMLSIKKTQYFFPTKCLPPPPNDFHYTKSTWKFGSLVFVLKLQNIENS